MRKTAQGIVEIGHKLIEVKEELPHGEFGNWLDAEFGWSRQTAWRFMNVADKFNTVKHLDVARAFKNQQIVDLDIGTSALYMLSAPPTPESAQNPALSGSSLYDYDTNDTNDSLFYTLSKTYLASII